MHEEWGGRGTATAPAAPGWYADPWGQAPLRFWDGAVWTPQTSAARGKPQRPRVPAGASLDGPEIWLLAVLPILGAVTPWLMRFDASGIADYVRASRDAVDSGSTAYVEPPDPFSIFGAGYGLVVLLGITLSVVLVLVAWRDAARLARVGVVRPFHWAWSLLGPIVYVIGRSVVVRKVVTPWPSAPLWTAIVVTIVTQVSAAIWAATFLATTLQQVSDALR